MTLTYPQELHDRLATLLEDVGPLHTVSGLGVEERDPVMLSKNLDALRDDAWSVVDLRTRGPEDAVRALRFAWRAPVLVPVVRAEEPPQAVLRLVDAMVDRRADVELEPLKPEGRTKGQSVVVVVVGASEMARVPAALREIAYWDFVPQGGARR
ncbi:MAG: hypothetical protein H6730_20500 [Deltaproteobacteria bacterium]|nr:hypothetical protein [Deltaproteobacteria bacterium]